MSAISIKQLLEAGVHFGHQTHRWNPKMKEFIFGERNGIYIIDLQQTLRLFKHAVQFVTEIASQGKTILFVGTKRQAQEAVEEEAQRCGMYFVNNRWLGGLLTNFATIQNSLKRYKELESMQADGFYEKLSKKEAARLERERKKLEKNLRGIKDMDRLPAALFVVDANRETIAVREASRLSIPIVAIVDTNSDPDLIDYVIPGNDDALRAVRLFASTMAEAVRAGRADYEARIEKERREAREREAAARAAARKAKEEAQKRVQEQEAAKAQADANQEAVAASKAKAPEAAAQEETVAVAPEGGQAEPGPTVSEAPPQPPAEVAAQVEEASKPQKTEKASGTAKAKKKPAKTGGPRKTKATAPKRKAAPKKETQAATPTAAETPGADSSPDPASFQAHEDEEKVEAKS